MAEWGVGSEALLLSTRTCVSTGTGVFSRVNMWGRGFPLLRAKLEIRQMRTNCAPSAPMWLSAARRVGSRLPRLSQARHSTPCARVRVMSGAASAFDHKAWTASFLDAVKEVPNATDPAQSADVLRSLVRTGLLSFTDMRDAPEKFFLAHRLLVKPCTQPANPVPGPGPLRPFLHTPASALATSATLAAPSEPVSPTTSAFLATL